MTNHEDTPIPQKEDDLLPRSFPKDLSWSPSKSFTSLKRVYDFVNIECDRAISWYYFRKKSKKLLGYTFRVAAILAVAISGVIPILGEIYKKDDIPRVSPAWATVSLATAALFVALDQLGGYTSGWVRYVRTAQKLTIIQEDFRLDWEEYRLSSDDNSMDSETAKTGIKLCKKFLEAVNSEIQAETNAWAQEFQQALLESDKQSKAQKTRGKQAD